MDAELNKLFWETFCIAGILFLLGCFIIYRYTNRS